VFSSLSESGFIPTIREITVSLGRLGLVLISFREWLHSYEKNLGKETRRIFYGFSSLSESGFIPTKFDEAWVVLLR